MYSLDFVSDAIGWAIDLLLAQEWLPFLCVSEVGRLAIVSEEQELYRRGQRGGHHQQDDPCEDAHRFLLSRGNTRGVLTVNNLSHRGYSCSMQCTAWRLQMGHIRRLSTHEAVTISSCLLLDAAEIGEPGFGGMIKTSSPGESIVLLRVVSMATEPWPTMVSQPTMRQQAMDAELTEAETYLSEVATRPKLDHVPAALEPAASLIAALAAPAWVVPPVTAERGSQDGDTRSSSEQVLHKAKRYLSATVEHLHEGLTAPGVADLDLAITWSVAMDTDVASSIFAPLCAGRLRTAGDHKHPVMSMRDQS